MSLRGVGDGMCGHTNGGFTDSEVRQSPNGEVKGRSQRGQQRCRGKLNLSSRHQQRCYAKCYKKGHGKLREVTRSHREVNRETTKVTKCTVERHWYAEARDKSAERSRESNREVTESTQGDFGRKVRTAATENSAETSQRLGTRREEGVRNDGQPCRWGGGIDIMTK